MSETPFPVAAPFGMSSCPLILRAWQAKAVATAVILAYYVAGYFCLNRLPFGAYHDVPRLPFLDSLPLIPWTVAVYNSVFLLGALGIWLLPDGRATRGYLALALLSYTLNYIFFAVFPTRISRPSIPDDGSIWVWGLRAVRKIDAPHTCFPSLHITNCTVAIMGLWRTHFRWWLVAWTLAIAASTMTTGQHVFLDLPAGATVAFVARAIWSWLAAGLRARGEIGEE